MESSALVPLPTSILHLIPWIIGVILSVIAYRYRYTWWGRLALHEFGLRRHDHETETEFQRRRATIWLWVVTLLGLFVYVSGQRWLDHGPDAPLWEFLAVFFGFVFFFWSCISCLKAFVAFRRASKHERETGVPPNNRWSGP